MKKTKELTPKRKAFVQSKMDNPTAKLGQHALNAGYKASSMTQASKIGHSLMQEPGVKLALAKYEELFESALVGTVKDWKDAKKPRQREIAMNVAMFAFDHIHGKATTKIEQHTSVVRVSIDLTGSNEEAPEDLVEGEFIKAQAA